MQEATSPPTDNPCWGGPHSQQHDLEQLLKVLGEKATPIASPDEYSSFLECVKRKVVVFQDENYLVINKPPDLRMDGPYRASVHKLLLYLFPPPSLRSPVMNDTLTSPVNCSDATESKDEIIRGDKTHATIHVPNHYALLQSVSSFSKHSCLKDDPFRIVHQLDYATSGVLLYAKSKRAAGIACHSFQERKTKKQYVAVVTHKNADVSEPPLSFGFFQNLPLLPPSSLSEWIDGSLEKRYRKKRRRETEDRSGKKNTFDGFMPVHSVFAKWRGVLLRMKKEKEAKNENAHPKLIQTKKHHDSVPPLPEPEKPLTPEEIEEFLSLGPSWKAVKNNKNAQSRCWVTVVETMAREYNASLKKFHAKKVELGDDNDAKTHAGVEKTDSVSLPPLFRIQTEGADSKACLDTFYICAAIGEYKDGRFEVLVDPYVAKSPVNDVTNKVREPSPLPEFRPSLTKCTVLWRGCMQIDPHDSLTMLPVAKVLLQPWTGRRHQLRVHLAQVAGFPILGDVTYGGDIEIKARDDIQPDIVRCNECPAQGTRAACRRMCLHAKELSILLAEGDVKSFEAPDPFTIVKSSRGEKEILAVS
ncbi:hypothetical protein HJC23_007216 [Cyclotella cryptica]|uniref:Pseudouridine synthase RsuA/RluA-like domain-containing protein n=1 Tax=Cyclotella cryptica TaxID=29204 RepID=A0ABD3QTT5_9STRA